MADSPDRWHRWLLDVRFGGDAAYRERNLRESLYPVRDTVLDKARLRPGDTLLDVGAGDGLIEHHDFAAEMEQDSWEANADADPMITASVRLPSPGLIEQRSWEILASR